MKHRHIQHRQSGITLIGFILLLAVVGVFAYIGMKLFPMYSEYYSVNQALKALAAEPGITSRSPAKIQDLFFRKLYISYAENVDKNNVKIERKDYGYLISVKYEVRKPMIGNLDAVGRFETQEELRRGGAID